MRQAARDLCIPHERGVDGYVSCSFGVASTQPSADKVAHELIKMADNGLYAAKHAGRNRVTLNLE
jgi:diguanylate cyclase (GGDEF)-like protein